MGDPSATAVLVHGLWHDGWCWEGVRAALDERGVASVAVEMPLTDLGGDVAVVRSVLDGLDGPAVLVGHSYGGAVVTAAGTHPAVRELVYVAAFQLDEGESVSRVLPGEEFGQTALGTALRVDGGAVAFDPALAAELLYHDVPTAVADAATARLRPVGRALFRAVPAAVAWREVASTFAVCGEDRVVHPSLQRAMAARATSTVEWAAGHCVLLSRPALVADLVARRTGAA